jgi:alpha-N-acetylglucosamine transferase
VVVDEIESPPSVTLVNKGHRFAHIFTKLQIFNMTAYDAVLYLDADTLVLRSISDIFDVAVPAMVCKNRSPGMEFGPGQRRRRVLG